MNIHENFHVKYVFHHDKSNRIKVYACIRFVELCSTRNQC